LGFVWFIVGIAILLAVGWVMEKVGGFTLVGVNRGVFFRGEYNEGKKLRDGFTVTTSASVPEIMRELDIYVSCVDAPLGLSDVLYVSTRAEHGIAWTYGNASKVKLEAILAFADTDAGTDAIFTVTRWLDEDGLVAAIDMLKTLRMQIIAAIRAVDPDATITEGIGEPAELAEYADAFETTD